jgi:hypothetical protein
MNIETSTAIVSIREGIVVAKHAEDSFISAKEVSEIFDAEVILAKKKKHCILIDLRGFVKLSECAMKISASGKPVHYRKAAAFLVDSLAVRMQMQCYLNFARPKVPTQIFSDEDKALAWLRAQ